MCLLSYLSTTFFERKTYLDSILEARVEGSTVVRMASNPVPHQAARTSPTAPPSHPSLSTQHTGVTGRGEAGGWRARSPIPQHSDWARPAGEVVEVVGGALDPVVARVRQARILHQRT